MRTVDLTWCRGELCKVVFHVAISVEQGWRLAGLPGVMFIVRLLVCSRCCCSRRPPSTPTQPILRSVLHYLVLKRSRANRCDVCCTMASFSVLAVLYLVFLAAAVIAMLFCVILLGATFGFVRELVIATSCDWQPWL